MTDGIAETVSRALAAHEHAVVLRIEYTYYIHLNATRGLASITPRLLPYRPATIRNHFADPLGRGVSTYLLFCIYGAFTTRHLGGYRFEI